MLIHHGIDQLPPLLLMQRTGKYVGALCLRLQLNPGIDFSRRQFVPNRDAELVTSRISVLSFKQTTEKSRPVFQSTLCGLPTTFLQEWDR